MNIIKKIISIPLIIPMGITLYLLVTSDPIMKVQLKSFLSIILVLSMIVIAEIMAGIGLYYIAFKRFD